MQAVILAGGLGTRLRPFTEVIPKPLLPIGEKSLLEIQIETGRKHQIRVHLADFDCPIVGDHRYGAKTKPFGQLGLHAWSLSFNHPVTGERLTLTAPPPDFIQRLLPK